MPDSTEARFIYPGGVYILRRGELMEVTATSEEDHGGVQKIRFDLDSGRDSVVKRANAIVRVYDDP